MSRRLLHPVKGTPGTALGHTARETFSLRCPKALFYISHDDDDGDGGALPRELEAVWSLEMGSVWHGLMGAIRLNRALMGMDGSAEEAMPIRES